jgi:phage N-6-adenine-methyltransferase
MSTALAYGGKKSDKPYDTDAWTTPNRIFLPLHEQYHFTIDLFASDDNHKLPRYFTEKDDALKQSWKGERGFANPPWSITRRCLEKAHEERHHSFSLFLVKFDTSTGWFHQAWEWFRKQQCDMKPLKRIQFDPPKGYISRSGNTEPTSPNMGSGLITFGWDIK